MADLNTKYNYLSILKRPLDDQQLKVCCRTKNTVVAAGAGSGKTQVLATRFAFLLMEYDDITASSILTLTFTNKAASEMYLRIYDTLKVFAYDETGIVPSRQKSNAIRALNDFASVHIQTLDSYCNSIVKQAANRYGISPSFMISDGQDIKNKALVFLLNNINDKSIIHYCDPGCIEDFCYKVFTPIIIKHTSLATKKDYFVKSLEIQKKEIINTWNKIVNPKENDISPLGLMISQAVNDAVALVEDTSVKLKDYPEFVKLTDALLGAEALPDLTLFCIDEKSIDDENALVIMQKLFDALNTIISFKTSARKKNFSPLKEDIKNIQTFVEESMAPMMAYIKELPYIQSLFVLLDKFLLEVNDNKRQSGLLSFRDISEMALKILIEQKDIRDQEKSAYKKIMIDEFQDNNGKNRDLLFLLSEKNEYSTDFDYENITSTSIHDLLKDKISDDKLFFVGDEKQSIYKFRGAEVSVFTQLKQDMTEINGADSYLHMIYNYRSDPVLLSSFNQLFGGFEANEQGYSSNNKACVFSKDSNASYDALYTEDAVAKFVDKATHEEQLPVVLSKNNITSHLALFRKDYGFDKKVNQMISLPGSEQTAYFMACKIKEILASNENASIAILERSRTYRSYITSWLERFNINYDVDQQSSLFSDGPVNDIYSFLRLCVYPSDKKALCTYLCSPFAGLMEEDLEKILPIWNYSYDINEINRVASVLGQDSEIAKRFVKAITFFNNNHAKILSQKITDTLNLLWYDSGYRYETMLNSSVSLFEEHYDLLFELACQCDNDGKRLGWFIDQLEAARVNEDGQLDIKDVSYPLEKGKCVHIMSIHKSKGLQFDYVFITGLLNKIKSERDENFFFDENIGVSIKPASGVHNYFYLRQNELSSNMNLAEFRRLFYVAVTRAVKEFYIVGEVSVLKEGNLGKTNEVFDDIISQYYPEISFQECGKYYNEKTNPPFDLELIEEQSYDVFSIEAKDKKDIDDQRTEVINGFDNVYNNSSADIIYSSVEENRRISPSNLEIIEDTQEGNTASDYNDVDDVINKALRNNINFGYNDFGTLVHMFFQNSVMGLNYEDNKAICSKLLKKLDVKDQELLLCNCLKMWTIFQKNDIFNDLSECLLSNKFCKTEYGFNMYLEEYLIAGSIDLCYEQKDNKYVIIDYKTDHDIQAEKYYGQQTCYKRALSEILGTSEDNIRCILYYTRFGKAVDITDKARVLLDKPLFDSIKKSL